MLLAKFVYCRHRRCRSDGRNDRQFHTQEQKYRRPQVDTVSRSHTKQCAEATFKQWQNHLELHSVCSNFKNMKRIVEDGERAGWNN